ncbi:MAG TPA: Rne/Rng family ribonuclease [Desulfobacteraceae bacterium]|jgi:ribonuclease G|nr:Rne/Rng family ribonuclease [Desulfobacteraceae bacterium]
MAVELIIHVRPYETRVALVEKGAVTELYTERNSGQQLLRNIYRGRVVKVLPGMQAAFVDVGLDRTAFLYVSDVNRDYRSWQCNGTGGEGIGENGDEGPYHGRSFCRCPACCIDEILREGQDIMVQVSREPLGKKGARITSHVSLPGRHLVLLPTVDHIGVSRRIESIGEKDRLKSLMEEIRASKMGFIIRTVSEGTSREKLKAEADFLEKLWFNIQNKMEKLTEPGLLHEDLSISLRAVRDLFTREVDRLIIDSPEQYDRIMEFIDTFAPGLRYSVELYEGAEPIFDAFGIEVEISRALNKKVWLKSGGYIVIDHTEALTVVDVNTGSYVGARNLEETILKTNLEAVKEIAYQLKLRNIGGLIVIDVIDMEKKANREKVFFALKDALSGDKATCNVLPMSELGLIEMTRKRTSANLHALLTEPCLYCEGRGSLKSRRTICYEIFRELERECATLGPGGQAVIQVHPAVETVLMEEEQESLVDLERRIKRRIVIETSDDVHVENYQIRF